jgi:DnaJ-class molecular chaperone
MKRGFMSNYKTYDTSEGYGSPYQWRASFQARMSPEEAREILAEQSPYTILNIPPHAAWSEIKTAYRRMASKWHPDVCRLANAEEEMKRINAAFTTLELQFGK